MKDKKKSDQNLQSLENLSAEELKKRVETEKKNARRSLSLSFTAFIAIIAIAIAWFVSNTRVSVQGVNVSAENDAPFELASVGVRQNAEKKYLLDSEKKNILQEGKKVSYDSYIDISEGTEKEIKKSQEYHTGYSELAWHLEEQENLMPGANGKMEFYIIPKQSNLSSVTISLSILGYTSDDSAARAVELQDKKVQSLISGHILFFRQLDDTYGYHGWLGEDGEITVSAPNDTFSQNTPYKVTLYWVWPQYFRNYIFTQKSTEGDLFTDAMVKSYPGEYEEIIKFVNDYKSVSEEEGKFFYQEETAGEISADINNAMSDETLNLCSKYYNQADEEIGTEAKYIYVQIEVN